MRLSNIRLTDAADRTQAVMSTHWMLSGRPAVAQPDPATRTQRISEAMAMSGSRSTRGCRTRSSLCLLQPCTPAALIHLVRLGKGNSSHCCVTDGTDPVTWLLTSTLPQQRGSGLPPSNFAVITIMSTRCGRRAARDLRYRGSRWSAHLATTHTAVHGTASPRGPATRLPAPGRPPSPDASARG